MPKKPKTSTRHAIAPAKLTELKDRLKRATELADAARAAYKNAKESLKSAKRLAKLARKKAKQLRKAAKEIKRELEQAGGVRPDGNSRQPVRPAAKRASRLALAPDTTPPTQEVAADSPSVGPEDAPAGA
jgi:DNA repair exonuclease SbcCD ATPase subunit